MHLLTAGHKLIVKDKKYICMKIRLVSVFTVHPGRETNATVTASGTRCQNSSVGCHIPSWDKKLVTRLCFYVLRITVLVAGPQVRRKRVVAARITRI